MGCGTELAATEWGPSYERAARMQATLAVISTLATLVSWRLAENILWLVGAVLITARVACILAARFRNSVPIRLPLLGSAKPIRADASGTRRRGSFCARRSPTCRRRCAPLPWLPVRALLRDRFPVVEHLTASDVPITIVYGDRDSVVPPRSAPASRTTPPPWPSEW